MQDILPIRMNAVIGGNADTGRCHHIPLLHLADQMRCQHMGTYNGIRFKIIHKMLEFECTKGIDQLDHIHLIELFPVF